MARIRPRQTIDPRQAKRDLEESERRYQALVDQLPAIVYTADVGKAGRWRFVSHQVETMLGYTPREWMADPSLWFARLHTDDRERVLEAELALDVGDRFDSEYRLRARDDRLIWVRDEAVKVRLGDGAEVLQGVMLDVTDRHDAERALAASEQKYRHLVETSGDLIWSLNATGRCTFVNGAARTVFGYEPHEMVGRPFTDFAAPGQADADLAAFRSAMGGRSGRYETRHLRKDGSVVVLSYNAVGLRDPEGHVAGIMGTARDETEARLREAAMAEDHARLQTIIDNSPVMIFVMDRRHRMVLANSELESMLGFRKGEILGRTEEELLPSPAAARVRADNEQIMASGERLEIEESIPNPNGRGTRTFISQKFPLRDADGEVYGMCGILTDISERKEREEELLSKVEWSSRIREAIASDQFTLHAQPIVLLDGGGLVQEELLLRLVGADGTLVMPAEFLPAAERFGLAPEIDRWVVSKAAAMARHRRVEVNLSAKSIGDPTLPGFIELELMAAGADPENVVFEITETAAAEDFDQARKLADRLTRLGCGFALDDFGTGFGSFTYLKHLPVSFIKIDIDFVRELTDDAADRQVVNAIVGVARNFGIETIAEGVESAATMALLTELGVDYAQGFHIGRPAPAEVGPGGA
jgi:PAS domain S-box-containing protein